MRNQRAAAAGSPLVWLVIIGCVTACGGPGQGDGGAGGSGGAGGGSGGSGGGTGCSPNEPNSWRLGSQCWTAQQVVCGPTADGRNLEIYARTVTAMGTTGDVQVVRPRPSSGPGTYSIIPARLPDGGYATLDAGQALLGMNANIGLGYIELLLANSGSVTLTLDGGKDTASFTDVEVYARDGGFAGTASGSITCSG